MGIKINFFSLQEFLEDVIVTETNSKRVPLKQLGQVAYINKQTISVNLSTSPKVKEDKEFSSTHALESLILTFISL